MNVLIASKFRNNFKVNLKRKILINLYSAITKISFFEAIISSSLRILFSFKIIFYYYYKFFKSINLSNYDNFWIIRIGFKRKRNYLPFINIDPHLLNRPSLCLNINRLSCFKKDSCQMIYIKQFFDYFPNKIDIKFIKNWKNVLIPGGFLKLQLKVNDNYIKIEQLKNKLQKFNFFIKDINNFDIDINGTITVIAINEIEKAGHPTEVNREKMNDILTIVKQNLNLTYDIEKLCVLGHNLKDIYRYIKNNNLKVKDIKKIESIDSFQSFSNNYFDCVIIANFFEYCNYSKNFYIFEELRRVLKKNGDLLIILPERKNYITKETAQLFDKGIFLQLLDEVNIFLNWINLSSSFKMIQIKLKNKYNFPLDKNDTKVLLVGNYALRYTFLNNVRWDSQARAFEKLGYNSRIIDIKDHSFKYIIKYIGKFNPDILWIAGKVAYSFLRIYAKFFRKAKIKVIYWFWDIRPPIKFNFKDIIDCMFITSQGEVELYKKSYNIERIYYMPSAIMPEIIHRNKFIKEEYDIGFAGLLSYSIYHKKRTQIIKYISKYFKVIIFKNLYKNLPEHYNKCKIVFGGTPDLKDLELYASNRIYVALSCSSCFITNYFKGLERLAENKKHLLWYNNKEELISLLKEYLNNDNLRNEIRKNAKELAREKHHYILRLKNMMDIINDKTEDFYGFIN